MPRDRVATRMPAPAACPGDVAYPCDSADPDAATMPTRVSSRPDSPVPTDRATTRTATDGDTAPRLPHERDESSDSVRSEPTDVMRQAHQDLVDGKVDTDRGVPADAAYRKQQGELKVPASRGKPRR